VEEFPNYSQFGYNIKIVGAFGDNSVQGVPQFGLLAQTKRKGKSMIESCQKQKKREKVEKREKRREEKRREEKRSLINHSKRNIKNNGKGKDDVLGLLDNK